jgi:hypothetical protein
MYDEYRVGFCRWCGQLFYVCRSCYRGQVYCCQGCTTEGYGAVQDKARSQHQATEEGRMDHRDRMRARRLENKAVTDDTCPVPVVCASVTADFGTAASTTDAPVPVIAQANNDTDNHPPDVRQPEPDRCTPNGERQDGGSGCHKPAQTTARCAFCGVIIRLRCPTVQQPRTWQSCRSSP